jgi:hypothetical protein
MTAPIASGWSDCRVGFSPTGKRRLCTAHATNGHAPPQRRELLPLFDPTIKFSRTASRRPLPPPDRIAATIALEKIGPIPGTLISRSQPASWRANRSLCVSKTPIAL